MIDLKPMKMTDVSVTTAEQYITDPQFVMEQKMDGARALVSWTEDAGFTWQASGGGPLKFSAAVQHIEALEEELSALFNLNDIERIILDGELMVEEGEFRIFDLPYLALDPERVTVLPGDAFAHRRNSLLELFETGGGKAAPVAQAASEEAKREMWRAINAAGVEGAMVKHLDAPYESGVRTKSQLKLKLVKSADVIVTKVERRFDHKGMVTHGSADLAVMILPSQDPKPWRHDVTGARLSSDAINELIAKGDSRSLKKAAQFSIQPRELLPVGAASLIGKELTIAEKSIVEVNYLYWTGDALVQPRIVRERTLDEKKHEECNLEQLPEYSRVAVS